MMVMMMCVNFTVLTATYLSKGRCSLYVLKVQLNANQSISLQHCVVYMTADRTGHQSGTDATSSGVQSPDRIPRAHSVAGRQPSYAQPTVASLLRMSRSNDLLDGSMAVPICPRCRPRELLLCHSVCACFADF